MGIASNVLRVLSDFGDAAGWLVAALVLIAYGRRILQENKDAHAAITTNVQENRKLIDSLAGSLEGVGKTIHELSVNVAVLRDRSDRSERAAGTAPDPRVG